MHANYSSFFSFSCDGPLLAGVAAGPDGTGFTGLGEIFLACILRTSSGLETPKMENARPILLKIPLDIFRPFSFDSVVRAWILALLDQRPAHGTASKFSGKS